MKQPRIFNAAEIGNYVVCPEAWRLKYLLGEDYHFDQAVHGVLESKRTWRSSLDLSTQFKFYAKIIYILLIFIFIIVFLLDFKAELRNQGKQSDSLSADVTFSDQLLIALEDKSKEVPAQILLLLIVLGSSIYVWDLLDRKGKALKRETGIGDSAEIVALAGSKILPGKEYSSSSLQLASKPDALIKELGHLIPVDRKPMLKRIHDRNIAQMMVNLLLIEEIEGEKPPYGVLLLGKDEKKSQIKNTPERARWVLSLVDEMQSIVDGVPAIPSPNPQKCKNCDVNQRCEFSAYR